MSVDVVGVVVEMIYLVSFVVAAAVVVCVGVGVCVVAMSVCWLNIVSVGSAVVGLVVVVVVIVSFVVFLVVV